LSEKDRLVRLRKLAEKAVEDLPAGDLKLKAFEVAFRHLLDSPEIQEGEHQGKRPAKKERRRELEDEAGLRGELPKRVYGLRKDKFFAQPRSGREVQRELKTRGFHYAQAAVQMALLRLTRRRLLRRVPLEGKGARGFGYVEP
jgi:hypothetical protein